MTDWLPLENEMLLQCGNAGGEYLDSLGKSDLATMSKDEWLTFLQAIVGRLQEVRPDYDRKIEEDWRAAEQISEENNPFGLPPLK
jgi:hypothetical protein